MGHCPLLHNISVITSFTLLYLWGFKTLGFNPSCIGATYAPGAEGVDTKSQHNSSKSSCTSCTPSDPGFKLPIPLEEIPTVIPFLNNSFKQLKWKIQKK